MCSSLISPARFQIGPIMGVGLCSLDEPISGALIAFGSSTMTRLDRCTAAERVEERRRYRFSGAGTENSLAVVPLFLATAYLAFALGCETRRVNPGPGVDGSAGGAAGAAAAGGSGTGSAGGAGGLPHVVSNDGGLDCATVGCGAPPLCSVGCHEACGCCACADGDAGTALGAGADMHWRLVGGPKVGPKVRSKVGLL